MSEPVSITDGHAGELEITIEGLGAQKIDSPQPIVLCQYAWAAEMGIAALKMKPGEKSKAHVNPDVQARYELISFDPTGRKLTVKIKS